jgi:hypothetical protein
MSMIVPLARRLCHCGRLLTEPVYRRHVGEEWRHSQLSPRRMPAEATLPGRRAAYKSRCENSSSRITKPP